LNEHDDVIYFTVLTRAPTTAIWPPWPNVLVSPLTVALTILLSVCKERRGKGYFDADMNVSV